MKSRDFIRYPAIPLASFFQFSYNRLLKERIVSILYAFPQSPSPLFFNSRTKDYLRNEIASILYAIPRSCSPWIFNLRTIYYLGNEIPSILYAFPQSPLPQLFILRTISFQKERNRKRTAFFRSSFPILRRLPNNLYAFHEFSYPQGRRHLHRKNAPYKRGPHPAALISSS